MRSLSRVGLFHSFIFSSNSIQSHPIVNYREVYWDGLSSYFLYFFPMQCFWSGHSAVLFENRKEEEKIGWRNDENKKSRISKAKSKLGAHYVSQNIVSGLGPRDRLPSYPQFVVIIVKIILWIQNIQNEILNSLYISFDSCWLKFWENRRQWKMKGNH